jgi:hypothetical protein
MRRIKLVAWHLRLVAKIAMGYRAGRRADLRGQHQHDAGESATTLEDLAGHRLKSPDMASLICNQTLVVGAIWAIWPCCGKLPDVAGLAA